MIVLVSGATGFLGGAITRRLLEAGYEVRAMSRDAVAARDRYAAADPGWQALAEGRLTFAQADVTRPATLATAVRGVDAIVQAAQFTGAPVEDPARGLTYAAVDRDGTLNLLAAAQAGDRAGAAGRPRFLYMSGITVSPEATQPWNRAKWQAEEAIRHSGLDWTIVRSCWAYGPQDTALNRILGYSDYLPFVPIFGQGDGPLTPVYVEDVGRLFALLLADPGASRNTTFELGGPDIVTLREFLRLALTVKRRGRPILPIPTRVGKALATVAQHLPGRPLTPDAVDFVRQAGAVSTAGRELLAERFPDFAPTPLREGLAEYLAPRAR